MRTRRGNGKRIQGDGGKVELVWRRKKRLGGRREKGEAEEDEKETED